MNLQWSSLCCALIFSNVALAADLQVCTSIKSEKNRLACFDRFAAEQKTKAGAAAAAAKQAADLKIQQDAESTSDKVLVEAEVNRFKAALTERFKDPSSAQFKNVVAYGVTKPLRISFMCGYVNGKNSYGAYIGYKRFFMIGTEVSEIEGSKNAALIDEMWVTTCNGTEVFRQDVP